MEDQQFLRDKRISGMRSLVFSLGIIFLLALAFVMAILIIPPHGDLYQLEEKLQTTKAERARSKRDAKIAKKNLEWMQDPEFIEQIARDRANLAYPDEKIINLHDEDDKKIPPILPKKSNNDRPAS